MTREPAIQQVHFLRVSLHLQRMKIERKRPVRYPLVNVTTLISMLFPLFKLDNARTI